jgi:hypothetical protein
MVVAGSGILAEKEKGNWEGEEKSGRGWEDEDLRRAGGRELMVGPAGTGVDLGASLFDREFPKRRALSNSTLRMEYMGLPSDR